MNKHHKAALKFLWELWKYSCIAIGSFVGAFGLFAGVCLTVDAAPLPVRLTGVGLLVVGGLYWLGYSLSVEQD